MKKKRRPTGIFSAVGGLEGLPQGREVREDERKVVRLAASFVANQGRESPKPSDPTLSFTIGIDYAKNTDKTLNWQD